MNRYTILLFSIAALPIVLFLLRTVLRGFPKIKFRQIFRVFVGWLRSSRREDAEPQQQRKRAKTRVTQKFIENFEAVFGASGSFCSHDLHNVRSKVYTELYDHIISSEADSYKSLWNQVLLMVHPDRAANSPFTRDQLDVISQYYLDVFPKR